MTLVHRATQLAYDFARTVGVPALFSNVAVTRARRTLHASWARERGGREREISRYLADLG